MVRPAYITFREYLDSLDDELSLEEFVARQRDIPAYKVRLLGVNTDDHYDGSFVEYNDMLNMVFGQFVMLEQLVTGNLDDKEKLLELAVLIIRKPNENTFDNTIAAEEEEHRLILAGLPFVYVMGRINNYLKIRETFINDTFRGVFYKAKDDDEDEDSTDSSSVDNNDSQWYWYSLRRTLAKEDVAKYSEVQMMTMNIVAPEVAYLRHIQIKEEHERKLDEFKRKAKDGVN